jgi:hypothetical protein
MVMSVCVPHYTTHGWLLSKFYTCCTSSQQLTVRIFSQGYRQPLMAVITTLGRFDMSVSACVCRTYLDNLCKAVSEGVKVG